MLGRSTAQITQSFGVDDLDGTIDELILILGALYPCLKFHLFAHKNFVELPLNAFRVYKRVLKEMDFERVTVMFESEV